MPGKPSTWNDADILLRIEQLADRDDTRNAFRWAREQYYKKDMIPREFPPNSHDYQNCFRISAFFETVGTLAKHHLINEDLLFDRWIIYPYWDLFKLTLRNDRKRMARPLMGENFEWVAKRNKKWTESRTRKSSLPKKRMKKISRKRRR